MLRLTILLVVVGAFIEVPSNNISDELRTYLELLKIDMEDFDTIGVLSVKNGTAEDITNWYLKYKLPLRAVVTSSNFTSTFSRHTYIKKPTTIVCFVHFKDAFKIIIEYMDVNYIFNLDCKLQFIITQPMVDENWIQDALDLIWSYKIFNFVIVYEINHFVRVIGYNPFNHQILNFSNHHADNMYPDKLEDLNGYELTISMLEDSPRNFLRNGILIGEDANRVRLVAQCLNASLQWIMVDDYAEMVETLTKGRADFSFSKHFTYSDAAIIINPSYPIELDYIVIAIPSRLIPEYKYLFLTFNNLLWYSLLGVYILFIGIIMLIQCKLITSELFFAVFQIFLNIPYINLSKSTSSIKLLMLSWTIFALLITSAFNTALNSSLVTPKYDTTVSTLDNLSKSDIRVAVNANFKEDIINSYPPLLNNLYVTRKLVKKMMMYKHDSGYILPLTFIKRIAYKKDGRNRPIFQVLDEYLVAGFAVYDFRKNSPFLRKIDDLLLNCKQFGLSDFGTGGLGSNVIGNNEQPVISLAHLRTVFYILGIGYSIGLLMFIAEYVYYKCVYINKR